tara:strand:- start:2960 stop:4045 length:1086 start_codon:yes stop_codon:yes gene_type:complete
MARVSASERRKARNKRLSRVPIGGGQGNRIGKKRREKAAAAKKAAAEKAAAKKAADLAKNFAKNPAGTTVESQLKYFSDPENRKKVADAVSLMTGKKSSKPTSSGGGGTASSGGGTAPKNNKGKITKINGAQVDYKKIFSDYANAEARQEKSKKDAQAKVDALSNKKEAATKPESLTAADKRRRRRENRVSERRMLRGIRKDDKSVTDYTQGELNAFKQAEIDKIKKRRTGRNQYLRNFATQLARGEQARRPGEKYEGNYKEGDNFGQKGGSKENVAETAQTEETVAQNKEKLNTQSNTNDFTNTFLGSTNFAQKEFNIGPEFDPLNINTNLTSSFNKGIATEDSTPQSAMRKLYNKKRGF